MRGAQRQLPAAPAEGRPRRSTHPEGCLHEFVASGTRLEGTSTASRTLDIAKRLLDFGLHAPTIYFPLIVDEALMVEPTETEPKESLDHFVEALQQIHREAQTDPDLLHGAPHATPVGAPGRGQGGPPTRPAVAGPLQLLVIVS